MAIGIACCALILLYVQKELSYDNYHPDAGQLYRVAMIKGVNSLQLGGATVSYLTAEVLENDYPEVETAARMIRMPIDAAVKVEDQQFLEGDLMFAEQTVLELFSIPFLKGNPQTALLEPNSIVITEALAEKYFGSSDVLGQRLAVSLKNEFVDYKITGVAQNPPDNTHFKYGLLAYFDNFESATLLPVQRVKSWFMYRFWTYIKLAEGTDPAAFEAKLPQVIEKYFPETRQDNALFLQPVQDIHLRSQLDGEIEANNDILYIYIFSAIALLVLIVACINFMNLTTARSIKRAKEVGMRKVLGAKRTQLIKQFLAESIMISLISVAVAMGFLEFLIYIFNALSIAELELNYFENLTTLFGFAALALFVGVGAGIYPAFFLSAFRPISVLKGSSARATGRSPLRKVLIVFQFGISIVLLIGIVMITRQLDFMQNKKLGFNKEQQLMIEPLGSTLTNDEDRYQTFKGQVLQLPNVEGMTKHFIVVGEEYLMGSAYPRSVSENEKYLFPFIYSSHDFASVYDLELVAGRDFSKDFGADTNYAYILNESAVKAMELEDPVGMEIGTGDRPTRRGPIVGVVKDFHFASLHEEIGPLVISLFKGNFSARYIVVKLRSDRLAETIAQIEGVWQQFEPNRPMKYSFLDDRLDRIYKFETQLSTVVRYFTILAMFIAGLGLFGMAAYAAEQRIKEIGIRKTLGASVPNIIYLFSADFFKLVLVANFAAWPLAYFFVQKWLENFAYRIDISIWVFLLSGIAVFLIALLTISYQTIKAALSNPVDTLRYE